MTGKKYPVTDETIGKVAKKQWELTRRMKEETVNPEFILKELQRIIQGMPEISPEEIRKQAEKCSTIHPNGGGRIIKGSYADPEAYISKDAIIGGGVMIRDGEGVRIEDNAIVYGRTVIDKNFKIKDSAILFDNAWVLGPVKISGEVWVIAKDGAMLTNNLIIRGNGIIVLKGAYSGGEMIVQ